MLLYKNSKLNKHLKSLFHTLLWGGLFALVLNKEVVVFIKDFIDSLPIGSEFIRSIAVEVYLGLKALIHAPSLLGVLIVFLQLFYITCDIYYLLIQNYPFIKNCYYYVNVSETETHTKDIAVSKRYDYLQLSRLLN